MTEAVALMVVSTFGLLIFPGRLGSDLVGGESRQRIVGDALLSLLCSIGFAYGLILFGGGWPVSASCAEIPVCRMALSGGL